MKYIKKMKTYMRIRECYGEIDMEIGYEKKLDDLVFLLNEKGKINNTVEVAPGFIIDLDKKDKIVAIEIVGCADQLGVSKEYVEKAKKEVFVETYEFSYKIIISFNDGEKEIKQRVLK